jgi:hypothetical protein
LKSATMERTEQVAPVIDVELIPTSCIACSLGLSEGAIRAMERR